MTTILNALRAARDARKRGRTAIIGAFWLAVVMAVDAQIGAIDLSGTELAEAVGLLTVATEYAWAKIRTRLGIAP